MEDEKIIGLYWERNEDAITETSSKYGKLFFRIASNILGGDQYDPGHSSSGSIRRC